MVHFGNNNNLFVAVKERYNNLSIHSKFTMRNLYLQLNCDETTAVLY